MGYGSAAVGAAGSIISDALSNRANRKLSREIRAWSLDQWHRQNAYNHPSAQMARLQEAGLNPHLIYGDSVSGASGNADKVSVPSGGAAMQFNNPMDAFTDARLKSAQTNNVQAQEDNVIQETALKGQQTAHEASKNAKTIAEKRTIDALRKHSVDAATVNVLNSQQSLVGKQIDNFVKGRTMNTQIKAEAQKLHNLKLDGRIKSSDAAVKEFQLKLQKHWGLPGAQSDLISNSLRSILGAGENAYQAGKKLYKEFKN